MLEEIKPGTKFKYVTPINAWSTDLVVGAIYFVCCYTMSRYSRGLETEFNRSVRR